MMLRRLPVLLLAAAGLAHGFKDALPFLMISSEPLKHNTLHSQQLSTAADLEERLISSLSHCEHDRYIFLSQPGMTAAHLQEASQESQWMEQLRRRVQPTPTNQTLIQVPNVLGALDLQNVARQISSKCDVREKDYDWDVAVNGEGKSIMAWELEPKSQSDFNFALSSLETRLSERSIPYVVVYAATPLADGSVVSQQYEMDEEFPPALHTDLKRDLDMHKKSLGDRRRASGNSTNQQAGLPLFETYQFLTPGIFMGLAVSLLLVCILWVGVSAIAGLEVSYKAFDKEMGPQAQNKGKQQ